MTPAANPQADSTVLLARAWSLAAAGRTDLAQATVRHLLATRGLTPGQLHLGQLLLAHLLRDSGRSTDAIGHYRQAISLAPQDPRAHLALADLLHALGRDQAAVAVYREALSQLVPSPQLHNNFGVSLQALKQDRPAAAQYRAALALDADFVPAWRNLARLLARQSGSAEAETVWKRLIALEPARREYALLRAGHCPRVLSGIGVAHAVREQLTACLDHWQADGFVPDLTLADAWDAHFPPLLAYHGEDDTALKLRYAAAWRQALPAQPQLPIRRSGPSHIGLVVTAHAGLFLRWLGPLLPWFGAQGARLTLFALPAAAQVLQEFSGPDSLVVLPQPLLTAAETIRRTRCDLLYYWESGSDSLNYFLPFLRLAPVQCHGFGWPITSGAPEMDICFSSGATEPVDAQAHYSERLIRLEPLLTFAAAPDIPHRTRADFGLPEPARLYLCCQDPAKLLPAWDALAVGVLARDPDGLLLLTASRDAEVDARLLARLELQPALTGRIRLLAVPAYDDFLGLLSLADLLLDSTGFGGVTTTLEALVCGTPVLTLPGAFQRGRYAQACYATMGLPELLDGAVAADSDDFGAKALPLASDESLRPRIRSAALAMIANPRAIAALGQAMLNLLA